MARIGTSDLDVFPLNLGGNTFGWTSDRDGAFAVLDAFTAGGGDFIDTADSYSAWVPGNSGGESETIIGEWMRARGNRDSVVVATKVSQHPRFRGLSAATVAAAADASLERLDTDRIDLYYAHRDDENTPLAETVAAFDALVKAGKVRYVGISNYSAARVAEWIAIAEREGLTLPVALQPYYNLVHRLPYETELAPIARANGLGVLPYYALASGFLTGKYRTQADLSGDRAQSAAAYLTADGLAVVDVLEQVALAHGTSIAATALAWLRARPGVVAPIASATSPAQLTDLLASATLSLDASEVAMLDEVSGRVR